MSGFEINTDNFSNSLFDVNLVKSFDESMKSFLCYSSTSKYTMESLEAIVNLVLHIDQHIQDANFDLYHGSLLCAKTNLRSILDALVDLYYIFSDSSNWYLRARSYYFSQFQGDQRWFQNCYRFNGRDILDTELKHLNYYRTNFFNNFEDGCLPSYVELYDLTKENWMKFDNIDGNGHSDWLVRYPWNNEWNNGKRKSYSTRHFFVVLGLEAYYVYLYIPLSQVIHSSSETVSGVTEKVSKTVFHYTPWMFFDPGFIQALMLLMIKVVELLVECVDIEMPSMKKDLSDKSSWEYSYFENKYSLSELNDKFFSNKNRKGEF